MNQITTSFSKNLPIPLPPPYGNFPLISPSKPKLGMLSPEPNVMPMKPKPLLRPIPKYGAEA